MTNSLQVNDAALTDAGVQAAMHIEEQVLHLVVGIKAEQYAIEVDVP